MRILLSLTLSLLLSANLAFADGAMYEVSITNITRGQTFTPQFVATHGHAVSLFTLGQPASSELAILAESGDSGPLTTTAASHGERTRGLVVPRRRRVVVLSESKR